LSKIKTILSQLSPASRYAVLILPIFISWAYRVISPAYWSTTDPALWFFLDSLAIFDGKTYVFVDHPGIPVQLAGSLLLAITLFFFENKNEFINYYIAQPETFFQIVNTFQLLLNIGTLVIFYNIVKNYITEHKTLAALALPWMFYAIHPRSLSTLATWSHNSFNILGALWLLLLYKEMRNDFYSNRRKQIFFGIAAGALAMIQLYLISWIFTGILIIFLHNLQAKQTIWATVKDGGFFISGSIISIILTITLIYNEIPRMIRWFITLASYDGPYGTGTKSIYSFELLSTSIQFWLEDLFLLYIVFAISLLLLGLGIYFLRGNAQQELSSINFSFGIGLLFHLILQFLLLSKMYYFSRYTLSLMAILTIFTVISIIIVEMRPAAPLVSRIKQAVYGLIIISMFFSLARQLEQHNKNYRFEMEVAVARSVLANTLAQNRGIEKNEVAFVYYEIVPTKCAGLLVADNSIKAFPEQISALCPNQYAINNLENLSQIDWDVLAILPIYQSDTIIEHLEALGAKRIPNSWGINRSEIFFINENK